MSTAADVRPRRDGDPVADILGIRLAHRAMRADLHRLTALARDVAAGRVPRTPGRAAAIAGYVALTCDSIHHHHESEDDLLWPVLAASAGSHVDLAELSDDHAALDPKLDRIRAAARALAARPGSEDAAGELARGLAELRDLLDEHIEEEEKAIFPVIERYVSVRDWKAVEKGVRSSGTTPTWFELPRAVDQARPEELAELRRLAGPVLVVVLAMMRRRYRRLERAVFGA